MNEGYFEETDNVNLVIEGWILVRTVAGCFLEIIPA
jgi:hypothetical protein